MKKDIKILYVDDEPINLKLFELNFSEKFEIYTKLNAREGLKVLEKNSDVDFIISDMKMPEMNGIQFIKKAHEKFPEKNYFILTGFDITNEIIDALNSKLILKYFQKPFDKKEIEDTIERLSY